MKLCTGDTVLVIAGRDKGKKGTILRVLKDKNQVVVADVNMLTKHIKKTPQTEGRKVRLEAAMSAAKVMLLDPETHKPTRIGYRIDPETRKKERFAKVSGMAIGRSRIEPKDAKPTDQKEPAKAAPQKGAFWQRKGFGSDAASGVTSAQAGPAQVQTQSRSGSRGS